MEIQITKKENQGYGGSIISPSGVDLLPKPTDSVEYTRLEKEKLNSLDPNLTLENFSIGANYVIVYGKGTSTENATELLSAYQKLKELPLYGGFNSGLNVPINRVVSYDSKYYKSKTEFSSTLSNYYPIEGQSTEYWQYLETFIITEIDASQLTESNAYWELLDESYVPTGNEYYAGNGLKTFELNEIVYNEVYDSENDTYVNVYFKCITPIILGDYMTIETNAINTINYTYSDDNSQILTYKCIKTFNYYDDTVLNYELFDSLGSYYQYLAASTTNRYNLIIMPGRYNTILTIDTQYFDVKSITGNYDVVLNGVNVTANNIHVVGLKSLTTKFGLGDNLSNITIENCYSVVNDSFIVTGTSSNSKIVSGTFIDCVGGLGAFGGGQIASGTFINCKGDQYSFGAFGVASGKFINCEATGQLAFGYDDSTVLGDASGTFINCRGSQKSFGGLRSSGKFFNCISQGAFSFGGYTNSIASGYYYNCIGGAYSFGGHYGNEVSTFSGRAYNCVAENGSFGNTVIKGILYNCIRVNNPTAIAGTPDAFPDCSSYYGVIPCTLRVKVNGVYVGMSIGLNAVPPTGTIVSTPTGDFIFNNDFTVGQVLNLYPSGTITTQQFTGKIINCVDATNSLINK
jgi:hypothetical protein